MKASTGYLGDLRRLLKKAIAPSLVQIPSAAIHGAMDIALKEVPDLPSMDFNLSHNNCSSRDALNDPTLKI